MHETQVGHKHMHTLQQIFQHPATHNLQWHSVVALVRDNGTVHEVDNGHLTFTVNGVTEIFLPTHDKKDISDVQQVLNIRHFLERAGFHKDGTIGQPQHSSRARDSDEKEQHPPDHGHTHAEQDRRAELQIKTQQHEQNDRSAFQEGSAQSLEQENRQK